MQNKWDDILVDVTIPNRTAASKERLPGDYQPDTESPPVMKMEMPDDVYKGSPVFPWQSPTAYNGLSDFAVDCRKYNAIHVRVLVTGTTPNATITVQSSNEAGGVYVVVPDSNGTRNINTNTDFVVAVGGAWAKINIASISGTFAAGQGYYFIVTPFIMGSYAATRDGGPEWVSKFGVSGAPVTSADMSGSAVAVTDAPTAGQKIVVTDIIVSVDTAMRVTLTEQTTGTIIERFYMAANSTMQFSPRSKKKLATADKVINAQTSTSGNIVIDVGYYSEA